MIIVVSLLFLLIVYIFCRMWNIKKNEFKLKDYVTENRKSVLLFWILLGLILVLIPGLRSYRMGIDTWNYVGYYNNYLIRGDYLINSFNGMEWGYELLMFIVSRFHLSYGYFLLIAASISIIPVVVMMYKYSTVPWLSLILYFGMMLYPWTFSAMRQSIAIGMIAVAYMFLKEDKNIKFIIFVLIASTFHMTAIVFLPVLLFKKLKINKQNIILILCGCGGLVVMKSFILNILHENARISYDLILKGGEKYTLIFFFIAFLSCFYYKKIRLKNDNVNVEFYISIVLPFLYYIVNINPILTRLTWYFMLIMIIYNGMLLRSIDDIKIRFAGYTCFTIFFTYNLMVNVMNSGFSIDPFELWF